MVKSAVWRGAYVPRLFLAVLLALTALLALRDFDSYRFGFTSDSVEYVLLAKALVNGPQYALNLATFFPEATQYPFGFPMVLIPFVLVAPRGFESAAFVSLAATLASVALLFLGWRRLVPEVDERWRYPVTAMFALSPTTLSHTRLTLSDPLFALLLLATLYFAVEALRKPEARGVWLRLGVACFFMIFTRSIGLVSLAAMGLYLVVVLRKQALRGLLLMGVTMAVLLGVVMALTPVTAWDVIPRSYVSAFIRLAPVAGRTTTGARATAAPTTAAPMTGAPNVGGEKSGTAAALTGTLVVNTYGMQEHIFSNVRRLVLLTGGGDWEANLANRVGLPWLVYVPALVMVGLIVLGSAHWTFSARARGLPRLSLFMFVGVTYAALVLLWRGGGERIWYPVQPHLYLTFLLGIAVVARTAVAGVAQVVAKDRAAAPIAAKVVTGVVGVVVIGWLGLAAFRDLTLPTSTEMWGNFTQRAEIYETHIEPDAVVLSDWAAYDAFYNGREMISIPVNRSEAELTAMLHEYGVRYLVVAADDDFAEGAQGPHDRGLTKFAPTFRRWLAQGYLTKVYQTPYPLRIWRFESLPQ